ncbi:MAG TPA: protein-L-isoaspartate(D-aspartate) O-methyltransferase [Verrucomicrobiae bacterium]|nr:protein-L-isoaspartate(D-aspartate) O-methyltransferase [Verrucomicrobiae bacterium]
MIPDWFAERHAMVQKQLRRRGIRDPRVLSAMARIPREEFIPTESRLLAYSDDPIPIGWGQTISQPYMTALMAEALELCGSETVLEVGAGCGYAAAVLGALAARVVAVEIVPALAARAQANLRRTGLDGNIEIRAGDGAAESSEGTTFEAVSVAAAAPEIPLPLLARLRDPGRLVMPVGSPGDQELRVVTKLDGRIDYRVATLCRFVPLRGAEGFR